MVGSGKAMTMINSHSSRPSVKEQESEALFPWSKCTIHDTDIAGDGPEATQFVLRVVPMRQLVQCNGSRVEICGT